MSWPAYLETWRSGELERRVESSLAGLERCTLCPRDCGVNRLGGETATCRVGRHARVASSFPHFGEENCLRGWRGSGTVFFSWCSLRCVFCQNWDTSNEGEGVERDAAALADLFLALQERGCHNLNLVTPEHVVPQILEALGTAIERGLRIPIVYNSSGYDALETLRLLDEVVDIYMPDFKFWDELSCRRYLRTPDYAERAREALHEMHRQVGDLTLDDDGVARRGVLVRHLVMPGALSETEAILRWIAADLGPDTWVNVMPQYRPEGVVGRHPDLFPEISRRLAPAEWEAALRLAREAGLSRLDGLGA